MVGAVAAGIIAGIVGFLPLFVALRISRRSASASPMAAGMYGLVGVFFSLIILAAALFACSALAHDAVLPFGLAEMVALIVSTSVYVVYKNVLAKRKKR